MSRCQQMLSVRKAEARSLFGCALLLFVTAAGQTPVSPEILMTAYNPGMRLLALPVIDIFLGELHQTAPHPESVLEECMCIFG